MPRVVPSVVVRFIDSSPLHAGEAGLVSMNTVEPAFLSAVLSLSDQVPDELLTMDNDTYASLIHAKVEIEGILATWTSNRDKGYQLEPFRAHLKESPLARIRHALAKCPDESPAPGTSELNFIADPDLRTELRDDIGRINRALANGEWKGATVLAGSVVEALLLWALMQRSRADIAGAIARASGKFNKQPSPDGLDWWGLHEYIEVAAELAVIKTETAVQTRLTKDFRNLIHPGRAQRLAQKCDRGTALSAVAGVEHVVRDLTP
jgi:hypothetical protein